MSAGLTPRQLARVTVTPRWRVAGGLLVPAWTWQTPLVLQEPDLPPPPPGMPWWQTIILACTAYLPGGPGVTAPSIYLDAYDTAEGNSAGSWLLRCDAGTAWTDAAGNSRYSYVQRRFHGPEFARRLLIWLDGAGAPLNGASGGITLLLGHEPTHGEFGGHAAF